MQSTFRYNVHAGNAGDTFAIVGVCSFTSGGVPGVTRIVEMMTWDNPAMIMFSYDGIVYGDEIEIDHDDPPVQLPHAARSFQIRNKNTGAVSRYQIAGYW